MPYNTRRKSLSLPSLGIHVPVSQAARAAAAALKNASRSSSSTTSSTSSTPISRSESESHPTKRQKRSHGHDDAAIEQTPPPSPTLNLILESVVNESKIDLEAVNDDIVEAVIAQLQSTANRPHLVKELATVLAQRLTSVQQQVLRPSLNAPTS